MLIELSDSSGSSTATIVDWQHPKHHAINEVEPEKKSQQPEVSGGVGCEEVFHRDGALIADKPFVGVDRPVASEPGFRARLTVHCDIRSLRR
jgi:hypothetical protein